MKSGDERGVDGQRHGTGASLSERTRLAASILRFEAAQLRRTTLRNLRVLGTLNYGSPERLLIAPQDIRTADPTVAADIYAGHLVFSGSFVDSHGQSPFEIPPPNAAWAEELHGFSWLRHLRAANTGLSRANARALVADWILQSEAGRKGPAWVPAVVARRLLSWLSQSPMLLTPPDAAFYRKFMKSIGRQTAFLQRALAGGLSGDTRLFAAVALAEVGLCAEGLASARKQGSRLLIEELNLQILTDGGHISRNPSVLVELLLDLLPLRQSYASRGAPVPPPLLNAIDRIIPMIRLFRHGDGTLALFNGMGVTEPDVLATVLTYDDVRARALTNAPHSGYQRVEADGTLLVCDVGAPPPRPFSTRAHAGTLAFELSAGAHRLVVNCGRPATRNRRANEAARSTAAHSTLILGDASSCRFATPALDRWMHDQIVSGPRSVGVKRIEGAGACEIIGVHDGYAERFGLLHRRRLLLDFNGHSLRGEDSLEPAEPRAKPRPNPFVVRFHLHPAVRAQPLADRRSVLLSLPNDDRWIFESAQGDVTVEESILFAVAQGARPTSQIAVAGRTPDITALAWSFTRLGTSAT